MQASSVKIAWKVMLAMGIYVVVLSLLWLFGTKAMVAPSFTSFTGQGWSDFVTGSPKSADFLLITSRLTAAMGLVTGILAILIAWKSYSKAEKWSWYAFLVGSIIAWGSCLTFQIIAESSLGIALTIVGIVLFAIGITLPAKAILAKKSA